MINLSGIFFINKHALLTSTLNVSKSRALTAIIRVDVTKAFAKILASVGADQRINIAQGLSEIGTDSDEPDHVFYYTHLASLSDEAIKKIKGALD